MKREQVGAQHLICVSKKPFPASVIADAQRRGPAVRLVMLRELEHDQRPLECALGSAAFSVRGIGRFQTIRLLPQAPWPPGATPSALPGDAPWFERDGYAYSLDEIAKHAAMSAGVPPDGIMRFVFRFRTSGEPYKFLPMSGAPVHVAGVVPITVTETRADLSVSSYEQVDHDGIIAWILRGSGLHEGRDELEIKVTFTPSDDGRLRVSNMEFTGRPGDGFSLSMDKWRVNAYPFRAEGITGGVAVAEEPKKE
jgi:hypothetical protein